MGEDSHSGLHTRETIRFPEWLIGQIEDDVSRGKFANKSDAVRYILTAYYDQEEFSPDVQPEGDLRGGRGIPTGGLDV